MRTSLLPFVFAASALRALDTHYHLPRRSSERGSALGYLRALIFEIYVPQPFLILALYALGNPGSQRVPPSPASLLVVLRWPFGKKARLQIAQYRGEKERKHPPLPTPRSGALEAGYWILGH